MVSSLRSKRFRAVSRVKDRVKNGASKRGGGGEERKKERKEAFPSPFPLFHFLALVSFLARPKPRISFLGLSLLRNSTETLATQAKWHLSFFQGVLFSHVDVFWLTVVPVKSFKKRGRDYEINVHFCSIFPCICTLVQSSETITQLCPKFHLDLVLLAFLQSGGQNYDIKLVLFKPKVTLYFKWSWEMKKKNHWPDNIIQGVVQQKKIVVKCL